MEADGPVKLNSFGPLFVGSELNNMSSQFASSVFNVFKNILPKSMATIILVDPDAFNQNSQSALIGEIPQLGKLEHAQDFGFFGNYCKLLASIGLNLLESFIVDFWKRISEIFSFFP